ncbi:calcium-binding protein [Paludibacterium purpuratum]|uniref:Putative secreted protein (Type I secretion substrate) n=1 Tax=Paludibacterium purpuratum TaxID=1144873 RepID=A0A4R7B3G8_9NEIS|nr:calcium-binding protein [Paludibacterium purpuratum]TDR78309.1 putative secreted protein (type I secretion substrate) [Paludibacterium purpuratum]
MAVIYAKEQSNIDPSSPFAGFKWGSGTEEDDVILGSPGDNNTLYGYGGNDFLACNGGTGNALYGGDGNDELYVLGNSVDAFLSGGRGNDLLVGGLGSNTLIGGSGDDRLFGNIGNDVLEGDGMDDELLSLSDPHNFQAGGNDTLWGGGGNDTLIGGKGNDTLTGGSGRDTFVWDRQDLGGVDRVTDFDVKEDYLKFSNIAPDRLSLSVEGQSSWLSIRGGDGQVSQRIELENTDLMSGQSEAVALQKLIDQGTILFA